MAAPCSNPADMLPVHMRERTHEFVLRWSKDGGEILFIKLCDAPSVRAHSTVFLRRFCPAVLVLLFKNHHKEASGMDEAAKDRKDAVPLRRIGHDPQNSDPFRSDDRALVKRT
jgi:hypothetical protein